MEQQEKRAKRYRLRVNEKEIKLISKMIDEMSVGLEVIYYLLDHKALGSFVIVLMSAENIDIHNLIRENKRETDLAYCLDEASGLHAVLCQETKIDGGYMFGERITEMAVQEGGRSIYCAELEVRTSRYNIKDLIFKIYELYRQSREEQREKEVVFRTIN